MTPHQSLSDADVDAIEARVELWRRWAPTQTVSETVALCAEVRRLRAIVAALTTEPEDVAGKRHDGHRTDQCGRLGCHDA